MELGVTPEEKDSSGKGGNSLVGEASWDKDTSDDAKTPWDGLLSKVGVTSRVGFVSSEDKLAFGEMLPVTEASITVVLSSEEGLSFTGGTLIPGDDEILGAWLSSGENPS